MGVFAQLRTTSPAWNQHVLAEVEPGHSVHEGGTVDVRSEACRGDSEQGVRSVRYRIGFTDDSEMSIELGWEDQQEIAANEAQWIRLEIERDDGEVLSEARRYAIAPNGLGDVKDAAVIINGDGPSREELTEKLHRIFVESYVEDARQNREWHESDHLFDAQIAAAMALAHDPELAKLEVLACQQLVQAAGKDAFWIKVGPQGVRVGRE